MKNRFFLITLVILTMGLFVPSNVRAEDAPEPDVQPQAQPQVRPQWLQPDPGSVENNTRTKVASARIFTTSLLGAALHHLAAGKYSTAAQVIAVVVFVVIELTPMGPRGSPGGDGHRRRSR